jgi:hypothetical protein
MSAINPHSKRLRRRSSISASSFGRTIAGDHDLLHGVVQSVEGVEELFLGAFFAGEELDVVDEQDVDAAELVAEAGHLVVAQRVDHVVGELLAGDVADGGLRLATLDFVSDGLHEVRLAHADAAIEEERVVGFGRTLGDGLAGGVGELVAGADDESVEGVARIQLRGAIPIEAGLGWSRGGRSAESPPLWRTVVAAGSSSGVTNFTSLNSKPRLSMASWMRSAYLSPAWRNSAVGTLTNKIPPLEWL